MAEILQKIYNYNTYSKYWSGKSSPKESYLLQRERFCQIVEVLVDIRNLLIIEFLGNQNKITIL